jgi:hypothetical protein
MTSFFEQYGYPVSMKKAPRQSKSGIQTVFESKVYQEFKELRGPSWSVFNREYRTKKEISDWKWHQEDYEDVKNILAHLRANLVRAANRGNISQKITVTLDDVYYVGSSQDFECALTGQQLEFTRGGTRWLGKWCNPNSCTIDRIDSTKGYVKDNIQLVTWKANCLKQAVPNDEFIEFCKDVARHNK